MGEHERATLAAMFRYYAQYGLIGRSQYAALAPWRCPERSGALSRPRGGAVASLILPERLILPEWAMPGSDVEVVVVGGAAGVAAARRLCDAGVDCLVVEARPRLGGRAWTVINASGFALDLGCGWLHSAESNPWVAVAEKQGASIDKTRPPWARPSLDVAFPRAEQDEFQEAMDAFFARLEQVAASEIDVPAAAALETGCRWNGLINAISTYISGAEWDLVSGQGL